MILEMDFCPAVPTSHCKNMKSGSSWVVLVLVEDSNLTLLGYVVWSVLDLAGFWRDDCQCMTKRVTAHSNKRRTRRWEHFTLKWKSTRVSSTVDSFNCSRLTVRFIKFRNFFSISVMMEKSPFGRFSLTVVTFSWGQREIKSQDKRKQRETWNELPSMKECREWGAGASKSLPRLPVAVGQCACFLTGWFHSWKSTQRHYSWSLL